MGGHPAKHTKQRSLRLAVRTSLELSKRGFEHRKELEKKKAAIRGVEKEMKEEKEAEQERCVRCQPCCPILQPLDKPNRRSLELSLIFFSENAQLSKSGRERESEKQRLELAKAKNVGEEAAEDEEGELAVQLSRPVQVHKACGLGTAWQW